MTIGFIGNPNCGKTTLFNAYTGANLKVANWPGVTVEKVEGAIKDHDLNIRLVDLPGTYSLTSYTMEEQVSRQFILSDEVDVIIDVADASALERNLYLTLQLLELGKPVVLALNMMDIVEKRGMEIDTHRLPEMLGIPVIPVSARKRTGLDVLLHAAAHHKDCKDPECLIHHHKYTPKHRHDHHSEYAMVYSDAIEDKIDLIMAELKRKYPNLSNYRWHAIKLLEQDKEISARYPVNMPDVIDRNYESDIINEKYDFIEEIIREVLVNKDRQDALTEKADRVLTHKFWSIPIFLVVMAAVFFLTFTIGDWLKGFLELGIESLSALIYSSRYALSSIVYCAHCNDIFRRINWNNRGCKSTVWRCLSRVEKDRPSCTARTVKEELLHEVVVRAVNEVITGSASFIPVLQASFERCLGDSNSAAVEEIDAHLLKLQQELLKLANAKQNYDAIADEIDELRAEKEELLLQEANEDGIRQRMADMVSFLQSEPEEVTEYSEYLVRRMIEKITVYDDHFVVEFKSGIEITINE